MNNPRQQPLGRVTPGFRLTAVLTLAAAAVLMVAALLGGLARMGVSAPVTPDVLVRHHGPLMVSAFFGAVISMERAFALRKAWSFIAPLAAVAGGVFLVAWGDVRAATLLFSGSGLALVAVFAHLLARRFEPFTLAMGLGAAAWAIGNLLWALGRPIPTIVPWWAAFLVLTIAGERLELSRFRARERSKALFWVGFGITGLGLACSLAIFDHGVRLMGVGFAALAWWLARNDVGRSTIRLAGAPRFMAVALFAGYGWLAVAAILATIYGGVMAGPAYDAIWHAVFVGFVFSMIFAHAQVILPALSGLRVRYGRRFYAPLVLLHASLILRIIGDVGAWSGVRQAGGIGNVVAILLFAVILASRVGRGPGGKSR